MKVVFFGTSAFALPALRVLIEQGHEVLAVVTQPDRPAGRGHKLTPTPVRSDAERYGLPVRTPLKLREEVESLRSLDADAFVVVSYGRILPQALLDVPRLGALNIHPSLLPLYRGANPLAAPIRDGRLRTATTIIRMDAGMDTGDILLQEETDIGERETGTTLHDRLAERGAVLLIDALDGLATGRITPEQQNGRFSEAEVQATVTRPVQGDDMLIDWSWPAVRITNLVRAYADKPGARAWLNDEKLKVLSCSPGPQQTGIPGAILGEEDDAVLIACGDGTVKIHTLVPPGRSLQRGADYARRLRAGAA